MGGACLRLSTLDEVDFSKMREGENYAPEVGDLSAIEPFKSIA